MARRLPSRPSYLCIAFGTVQSYSSRWSWLWRRTSAKYSWGSRGLWEFIICGIVPLLGGKVCYKLTSRGLKPMLAKIPMAKLSKTVKDAMTVVRALGIRYIWIYTLCIIQDSVLDWQKESTRIGDIYKNSVCNIAASAASNGDARCFFHRDIHLIKTCRIRNVSSSEVKNSIVWIETYGKVNWGCST